MDYEVEEIIKNVKEKKNNSTKFVENNLQEEHYIGVLEIPKINLRKGFYDVTSKNNNVNKNIYVLPSSKMPNISASTLIIAAHSGNSYVGYFKELKKLEMDDEIRIYYNNILYTYYVDNYYEIPKIGKITFEKSENSSIIVLTTCSDNNKQLIVTAKLKQI